MIKYSSISDRAFTALNLKQYNNLNMPDCLGKMELDVPNEDYYILRMLIKNSLGEYKIPKELSWVTPLIARSLHHQDSISVAHSFCYLTIRTKAARTSDAWHVDGFSTKITHVPEQNYVWVNKDPTLVATRKFKFPDKFNSRKHNIHQFFQERISDDDFEDKGYIYPIEKLNVYCMDPYIIHKRPAYVSEGRMFIRVSHTPIEINDVNNTLNPLIPTNYTRDGIKDFRNTLERFIN